MDGGKWSEHSLESDWEGAAFMGFPIQRAAGEFLASRSGLAASPLWASAALQWVELASAGVEVSRRVMDAWQTGIRNQQNAFLCGMRDQLSRGRAHVEATLDHH